MRIILLALVAASVLPASASAQQRYYARELLAIGKSPTSGQAATKKIDCTSTAVSNQGFVMLGNGWVSSATMPATNMAESIAKCEGLNKAGAKYNLCVFYTQRAYAILFTNDESSNIQFGTATIPVRQTTCAIK